MTRRKHATRLPKNPLAAFLVIIAALLIVAFESISPVRLPQGKGAVELYSNQANDDLRATMLAAIGAAEESILLAIYNLSDGKVIKALKNKAQEGIPVTVIVDGKAAPQASKLLGNQVKTIRRSPVGLMHLKILVVDHKQVWIGSANMSYDSLRTHGNLIVAMENAPLAEEISRYLIALPQTGAAPPSAATPIRFAQEGQDGDLWFLPDNKKAMPALLDQIMSAKSSLKVAMFTWTHPELTQAIIDAHRRGVEVTAVIDHNQGQGAGAEVVHKLQEAGVPTYLSHGSGLLHYKMLIVDDAILVIGSANWTRSAFVRNDDCFLILWPLTADQQDYLRKMWSVIQHETLKY